MGLEGSVHLSVVEVGEALHGGFASEQGFSVGIVPLEDGFEERAGFPSDDGCAFGGIVGEVS